MQTVTGSEKVPAGIPSDVLAELELLRLFVKHCKGLRAAADPRKAKRAADWEIRFSDRLKELETAA